MSTTATYVAFLRGMNVGGHRITNDELSAHVTDLGFAEVWTFQASGNVVLVDPLDRGPAELEAVLERGLAERLGYAVPAVVRTTAEVRHLAAADPFDGWVAPDGGKLQVTFLRPAPDSGMATALADRTPDGDRAVLDGDVWFWHPVGGLSTSTFDPQAAARAFEVWTMRTQGTLQRLVKKLDQLQG